MTRQGTVGKTLHQRLLAALHALDHSDDTKTLALGFLLAAIMALALWANATWYPDPYTYQPDRRGLVCDIGGTNCVDRPYLFMPLAAQP
jgi:hypothetical protein